MRISGNFYQIKDAVAELDKMFSRGPDFFRHHMQQMNMGGHGGGGGGMGGHGGGGGGGGHGGPRGRQ